MGKNKLGKIFVFITLCTLLLQWASAQTEADLVDQLRADYSALLAARVEFEQAEKSRNTNSQEQADYADWIKQLGRQFSEGCRTLSSISVAAIPSDLPCEEFTSAYIPPVQIDLKAEATDAEKTAAMVAQFNVSLGDFDEKLLREQNRVKANRPQTDLADSGGGAEGGENGSEGESAAEGEGDSQGGAEGESGEGSEQGEGADGENGQQSGEQGSDSQSGNGQNQTDNGSQGSSSSGNQSSAPDDIPDGSDDDIIARQLREAAEKETDPELKKKLWDEYKRYKNGR